MCSRLKLLQEVRLVQRLFAQMVMWRKTGDRFDVGKKERPMGARLAHHEKARPTTTPCSLLATCRWPGLLGGGWAARCAHDSSFWVPMVMWRKASDPPFGVGKKARPMGARLAQALKSKANPLPAPLLHPLAPALAAAFVGAVVGGGVLVAKVFCANGFVAKGVSIKAQPMVTSLAPREKARPSPCSSPCSFPLASFAEGKPPLLFPHI